MDSDTALPVEDGVAKGKEKEVEGLGGDGCEAFHNFVCYLVVGCQREGDYAIEEVLIILLVMLTSSGDASRPLYTTRTHIGDMIIDSQKW